MIQRKVLVEITPSPDELAFEFANMGAEQQAMFFNELANLVDRLTPFEFRVRATTNHPELTDDGRSIMRAIGEYADRSTDKLVLPDSTNAHRRDLKAEHMAANAEIERLQEALFFWLPGVPGINSECADRIAHDADLLAGYEGRIDDSAEKRGWILLTPEKTALKLEP